MVLRKTKSVILRGELHGLVDDLPDHDRPTAKQFLVYLHNTRDPLMRKMVEIPYGDEPLSEEDVDALDEAWEDLAAGRVITMEELERELGL